MERWAERGAGKCNYQSVRKRVGAWTILGYTVLVKRTCLSVLRPVFPTQFLPKSEQAFPSFSSPLPFPFLPSLPFPPLSSTRSVLNPCSVWEFLQLLCVPETGNLQFIQGTSEFNTVCLSPLFALNKCIQMYFCPFHSVSTWKTDVHLFLYCWQFHVVLKFFPLRFSHYFWKSMMRWSMWNLESGCLHISSNLAPD